MKLHLNHLKLYNPLFLDAEFTGTSAWDEIIQLCILDIDENVLFSSWLKPEVKVFCPYSIKKHGKIYRDLIYCKSFIEMEEKISNIIKNRLVIAYNCNSDSKLLEKTYTRYQKPLPDSFFFDLHLYTKRQLRLTKNLSLDSLKKRFGIDLKGHDAYNDALSLVKIFKILEES